MNTSAPPELPVIASAGGQEIEQLNSNKMRGPLSSRKNTTHISALFGELEPEERRRSRKKEKQRYTNTKEVRLSWIRECVLNCTDKTPYILGMQSSLEQNTLVAVAK